MGRIGYFTINLNFSQLSILTSNNTRFNMNLNFLRRTKKAVQITRPKPNFLRDGKETIIGIGGSAINRIFVRANPGEKLVAQGKDKRPSPFTLKSKKE